MCNTTCYTFLDVIFKKMISGEVVSNYAGLGIKFLSVKYFISQGS
jgi:hypothetical protein